MNIHLACLVIVFGALMLIETNNAQYFSTSDGATLSRIGKRNYLYKLIYSRRPPSHNSHNEPSKQRELDHASSLSNLNVDGLNLKNDEPSLSSKNEIKVNRHLNSLNQHDNYNQIDKLSQLRKLHYKFGKRAGSYPDIDDELEFDDQDYNTDDSDEDDDDEEISNEDWTNNQQRYRELINNLMSEYRENLRRPFKNQLD